MMMDDDYDDDDDDDDKNKVGRDGALVEAMTFNRRVVGSTPALAAT